MSMIAIHAEKSSSSPGVKELLLQPGRKRKMMSKCSHTCFCNYPSFTGMTGQEMRSAVGFTSIVVRKTLSVGYFYKRLRVCNLPEVAPACECYKLAEAIKKHGAFTISWLCRSLLEKAVPFMIHDFTSLKKLPRPRATIIRFKR